MSAISGRALSAAIQQNLRNILLQGDAVTYQQLAEAAGCSVRSVRNYLSRAEDIFGFAVQRSRDAQRRTLVRVCVSQVQTTVPTRAAKKGSVIVSQAASIQTRDVLADTWVAHLFDLPESELNPHVIVSARGRARYSAEHRDIVAEFVHACEQCKHAVQLPMADGSDDIVMWPLCVVVHNCYGLLLVGLPYESQHINELRSLPLNRVLPDISRAKHVRGTRPKMLDSVDPYALLDLPFSAWTERQDTVLTNVHVRFSEVVARQLIDVIWHRHQQMVLRTDGKLDVRFGPVALEQAAAWVASFGGCVRVMGGKKLRRAVKKKQFIPPFALL